MHTALAILSINQPFTPLSLGHQVTCTPCITHHLMLTSRQLAKELISRKHHNQAETSINTSSYEMIDPVDPDSSVEDAPRRHFWGLNLRKRGNIHDLPIEEARRVVSEPLPIGRRKMSALRRFRFGRHEQDLEEEEGDLTISTETVSFSHCLSHRLMTRMSP
jgi:hypothetical protein